MQRLTRDHICYAFDRHVSPALQVKPGESFLVETEDSRQGRTRTPESTTPDALRAMRAKGYHGNPLVGPIFVEGAEPGDTLAVHVEAMECDSIGYFGHWPFEYHLSDWLTDPVTGLVSIADGLVTYEMQTSKGPHVIRKPVAPMIGTIGTAPEIEIRLSGNTGSHGGNLDTPEVAPGSTIYLPVAVPGAMLFLGDCHAFQGDAELCGIEMRSLTTLSVQVLKGWTTSQRMMRIETPTHLATVGFDKPAESAQWLAIREMIHWLEERIGWTKVDGRIFLNLAGEIRPGQLIVNPYTMRCLVPKSLLPKIL